MLQVDHHRHERHRHPRQRPRCKSIPSSRPSCRHRPCLRYTAPSASCSIRLTPLLEGYLGNPRQTLSTWYPNLHKPAFNPPNYIFPPVWTSLYAITGYASHLVARVALETLREPNHILARYALGLYVDQLVLNLAWTPLFFRARKPRLALTCISALFGVTASMVWTFWGVDRKAFALSLPYLGWLGYAMYLNYQIVKLNPDADEKGLEKPF